MWTDGQRNGYDEVNGLFLPTRLTTSFRLSETRNVRHVLWQFKGKEVAVCRLRIILSGTNYAGVLVVLLIKSGSVTSAVIEVQMHKTSRKLEI
jgi:hypothetical protein